VFLKMEEEKVGDVKFPGQTRELNSDTDSKFSQQNDEEKEINTILNQIPPNFKFAILHGEASKIKNLNKADSDKINSKEAGLFCNC
jgi:hypothetical protein